MNEKSWATIGKIITYTGIVVTLVLGLFQLFDRFVNTPSLEAPGEIRDYYLNPKIKELYNNKINKQYLIASIKERTKQGDTDHQILDNIENSKLPEKSPFQSFELTPFVDMKPMQLLFTVKNNGSDIARDVKLMLPGDGVSIIDEISLAHTVPKVVDWAGQIQIGDIRPQGTMKVIVWPKIMILSSLSYLNPAVTYSKGTIKVKEVHGFYGWDADMINWFVCLNLMSRAGIFALFVVLIVFLLTKARQYGYIVFKPRAGGLNERD